MTWSILARDPATGAFGVAVTTKFFAVGAGCPHAMSGAGALATQALINPTLGPRGLRLLAERVPAPAIVETLLASDQGREMRQLHVLDATGRAAAHTGRGCIEWCAHLPFAERLIGALDAGQAAGGDKRGKQSAALKIYATEEYPWLDIRVDDHPEPLVELRRLFEESRRKYLVFHRFLPTRNDPSGVFDRDIINAEVERVEKALQS